MQEHDLSYAPIGVFDSGVGGLTVAREIMRQMPNERIIYFGDTARVPYGSKSKETIIRFSRQIIRFLQSKGVKALVVACNTASALALEEIQPELDLPIIGVLKPGAKAAAGATKNGKIGVIATESTIASQLYTKVIQSHAPRAQVFGKACPLFVPLVEEEMCIRDRENGALNAMMSGSGPTVFGLFQGEKDVRKAYDALKQSGLVKNLYTSDIHNNRR